MSNENPIRSADLPPIPTKRYLTIGEVSEICAVKPHVLRYWEQEFSQISPAKRRGNRRYYQHHEVLMVRRIRELLYERGYTIHGARMHLLEAARAERNKRPAPIFAKLQAGLPPASGAPDSALTAKSLANGSVAQENLTRTLEAIRTELTQIRSLLDTQKP